MGIMASAKGTDYKPPEENIYNAVCVGVFDLGTHSTNFGIQHQIYIMLELECKRDDGKAYTIGTKLQPSLHKKANFRKLVEGWWGKKFTEEQAKQGFDCMQLLGKGCQVQVMHKTMPDGRVFANIGNIIKLGNGMSPLSPTIKLSSYSIEDNGKNIPADVPEWISKQVMESLEWKRGKVGSQAKEEIHNKFMEDNEPSFAANEAVAGGEVPF